MMMQLLTVRVPIQKMELFTLIGLFNSVAVFICHNQLKNRIKRKNIGGN